MRSGGLRVDGGSRRNLVNHEENKDKPRTHLGAYALCIDSSDRLLLCRMSMGSADQGSWTLPGGGIQWGEPPDVAVVRELQEETGLKPCEVSLVKPIYSEVYPEIENRPDDPWDPEDPLHHVGLLYRVRGVTGTLQAEIGGTTDLCAWLTREEAEKLPVTPLGRFALSIAWPEEDEADQTGRS